MQTTGPVSNTPKIRLAQLADLERLSLVLAQAFYLDPFYQWFFPDQAQRLKKCQRLFTVFLKDLIPQKTVFTSSGVEGSALWMSPEWVRNNWKSQLKEAVQIFPILGSRILYGIYWQSIIESKHPHYPHWHLFLLGVLPEHQGKGIASALLQPMLTMCDAERLPIYLDTGNRKNVPIYQHRGFKIIREANLPDGPAVFQMVRNPKE